MPDAPKTVSRAALRLVLFGMPNAGKSSLLGALAQAAQRQETVLNGRLTDLSQGLAELQRRLYDNQPQQTAEEVRPYPVVYETVIGGERARTEALLIDCDGRVVHELLNRRRELGAGSQGALGTAILAADAILLAIDASSGPAQVEADFTEFARFLHLLEIRRGARTEVGGLPVFLVLTKCDLLARSDDNLTAWIERIEERKQHVAERFRAFLARDSATPFGSIDLQPWATAIKRPALADSPARPQEPYGVAELFRQGFAQARDFRGRRRSSTRRLLWTVAGTGGVVAVLAGLAAVLLATRPGERASALAVQVEHFLARQQQLSPVARHQDVPAKLDELTRFTRDSAFADIPFDEQRAVEQRVKELTAYQKFAKALDAIPDPKEVRQESQLQEVHKRLVALTVPPAYQEEWSQTEAGRRRATWLEESTAIDKAIQETKAAYRKLIREGKQVIQTIDEPFLPRRAKAVLDQAQEAPNPKKDQDRPLPGAPHVTYRTVFGFAGVEDVVRQWEDEVKKVLEPFARKAEKS